MNSTARGMSLVRLAVLAVFGLAIFAMPANVKAQDAERQPSEMLEDFVHYGLIARPDLARAWGEKLLQSGASNAQLAELVDGEAVNPERFDEAIGRMLRMPELEDIAAEVNRRIELGRLELARDTERIRQAIEMLGGTQRQQLLAEQRIEAAGEYAMPLLFKTLSEARDERMRLVARSMIVQQIGRQAVTPLCEALFEVAPPEQRSICDMLGEIGYPHAAPFLLELAQNESAPEPSREAARRALRSIDVPADMNVADAYARLARQYYDQQGSLIAFPYEPTNNIWRYDPFIGLVPLPTPTEIYGEVMAMRRAAHALDIDAQHDQALSLYVAANLKRENDLPQGQIDPVYGDSDYTPQFYATVFGTGVNLDVLALALQSSDTPLIRDALDALSETTGGSNLFPQGRSNQPLLEALSYPDRRVQYDSALILARALPNQDFPESYRVVPLLASAVRTGGESYGVVIADDDENRRQAASALESMGFTVVAADASVGSAAPAFTDAPGIDIAIVRMGSANESKQAVQALRQESRTAVTPVLVFASGVDVPGLRRDYQRNPRVRVSRPGLTDEGMTTLVENLLDDAVGGRMTEAEAEVYAIEALAALRDVAIAGSPAFNLLEAETALIDALSRRTGGTRMLIAEILARMNSRTAQRALFDAGLEAQGAEQIGLLDQVTASVKRFGNLGTEQQIAAVLQLVETSSGETAEAAARLHGALNLPDSNAVKLILDAQPED